PETAQARRYVSRPAAAASRARATANPMAGSRTKKNSRSRSGGPTLFERLGRGDERDRGGETSQRIREILGLLFVGLSLWLVVALASYEWTFDNSAIRNWGGQAGWYLASWVFALFGWSSYLLAALALAWGCVLVTRKGIALPVVRLVGGACFLLSTAFLFQLAFGDSHGQHLPYGPGGYFALELVGPGVGGRHVPPILVAKLGSPGLWILLVLTTLISFMLATEMAFYPAAIAFRDWIAERQG